MVAHWAFRATSGDRQVLVDDSLARVDEDECDIGPLGSLERAELRVVLDPLPLLPRLGRPAVSTRTNVVSSRRSTVSMASRVVPGTSDTMTRSRPRSAFSSEDLPTFGRPRIAT